MLLTGATIALIGVYREPERNIEMSRCAGTPCWNAIVPGKTGWADALTIISAHSDPTAGQVTGFPSDDGQSVASLLLTRPTLRLGEVIALYGKPQCVDIFRQVDTMTLHYTLLHVLTRFQNDHLSPDSPILSLVLGALPGTESDAPVCDGPHSAETDLHMARRRWLGYASLQIYLAGSF
jgi:hypothetical protein